MYLVLGWHSPHMLSSCAEGVGLEALVWGLGDFDAYPVQLFSYLYVSGRTKASLGPSCLFVHENCSHLTFQSAHFYLREWIELNKQTTLQKQGYEMGEGAGKMI